MEPDNESDQSGEGAVLWLICDDCGGEDGAEFDPIESVPLTEIAGYGNKGQDPAPWRLSGKVEE